MERFEAHTPKREKRETGIDSERVQLTEKCLQMYYAKQERSSDPEIIKAIENTHRFFREWLASPQGVFLINMYTQMHTEEETRSFKDMGPLIEEFEAYHSRGTETLH